MAIQKFFYELAEVVLLLMIDFILHVNHHPVTQGHSGRKKVPSGFHEGGGNYFNKYGVGLGNTIP